MDRTLRMSLLFDFYGSLLTERQQGIFQMYFHEDLSLGEISEALGISRQAVYDILKRSRTSLAEFDAKLSLVEKHRLQQQSLERIQCGLLELQNALDPSMSTQSRQVAVLQAEIKRILEDS